MSFFKVKTNWDTVEGRVIVQFKKAPGSEPFELCTNQLTEVLQEAAQHQKKFKFLFVISSNVGIFTNGPTITRCIGKWIDDYKDENEKWLIESAVVFPAILAAFVQGILKFKQTTRPCRCFSTAAEACRYLKW
jgi:hypothetical protein